LTRVSIKEVGLPGVGERSDAVLRTAMPGNDDLGNVSTMTTDPLVSTEWLARI
jgi:hypothetical protein